MRRSQRAGSAGATARPAGHPKFRYRSLRAGADRDQQRAGILVARRWQLRWGATVEESGESLPGDDLISDPDLAATRAVTVGAAAGQVWPWIAQLGQGRGGFYSYDFLENLAGCDIHSADQIVPGWQGCRGRRPDQARAAGCPRRSPAGAGTVTCPARRRTDGGYLTPP
jgi:hypothetical protein